MLDLTAGLRELSSRTSRRGVLARVGSALVVISLYPLTRSFAVDASSGCICGGAGKCGGYACGSTVPNTNSCCGSPPCVSCGSWCNTTGGVCPSGWTSAWYWYCCQRVGESYTLTVCQDCCSGGQCCTARGTVGGC